MSGTQQHILPQFLLKGFASQVKGKNAFTFVYQKDKKLFETNIKNVAKEGYFYGGKEGETNADGKITRLEVEYSKLLEKLRNKDDESEVFDSRIAEFIVHLCARTKHLRASIIESSGFLVDKLPDYLNNFNSLELENLVYEKIKHELYPNKKYRKKRSHLKRVSTDKNNHNNDNDKSSDILKKIISEFVLEKKPHFEILAGFIGKKVKEILPYAIREGHNRALLSKLVPKQQAERYHLFRWFVYMSKDPLILGDVGCLFENSGPKKFNSIGFENDGTKNIFLPISTEKMLIGTSISIIPKVDFKAINEAIAKCSREFFICSTSSNYSPDMDYLHSLIGEESEIISQEELEQICRKSMEQG